MIRLILTPSNFVVDSGDTSLLFAALDAGAGLSSITHAGETWFVDEPTGAPLWLLAFEDSAGVTYEVTNTTRGATVEHLGHGRVSWTGVPIAGNATCRVTVTWTPSGEAIEGHIAVEDFGANLTLRSVEFPVVKLRPTPSAADAITLVMSRAFGRSWRDPWSGETGYQVGANLGLVAPGPMQFGALVDDDDRTLYWATHDPDARLKAFVYDNATDDGTLELRIRHVPEDQDRGGNELTLAYPVVLRTLAGDWWDAAQVYRAWALDQKWAAGGALRTRSDVPAYLTDCHAWVRLDTGNGDLKGFGRLVADYPRMFGTDVCVQWYDWYENGNMAIPDNKPWDLASGVAAHLRQGGAYTAPYLNTLVWDEDSPTWRDAVAAEAMRDDDGAVQLEPIGETEGDGRAPIMCASSVLWKERMNTSALALVGTLGPGLYLDQLGIQITRPCFSSSHGHPVGGGTYAASGVRDMLANLRASIRAIEPDAFIAGEDIPETVIDQVDFRLNHYNLWQGQLPLWAAVYGDHCLSFGRTIVLGSPLIDGAGFGARVATDLLRGAALGRIWADPRWAEATYAGEQDLVRRAVAYRALLKDYLVLGHLQRPLSFDDQATHVSVQDAKGRRFSIPAVAGAVWSKDHGSVAVVVLNVSTSTVECTWSTRLSTLELTHGTYATMVEVSPDGEGPSSNVADLVSVTTTLTAWQIRAWVIQIQHGPAPPIL